MTAERSTRDDGFTLVEVIIVVAMLGLVMSALAAAFVVVLRVSPASEARADDARALLGLTNWIAQDVASAEEDGFVFGPHASSCTSGVPAATGLLELRWSEDTTDFFVGYRYVAEGPGTGAIVRFSCKDGGAASALRVSPTLRDQPAATFAPPAPVNITPVPTLLADGVTPGNKGVQFQVFVLDANGTQRELLSLDATTSNRHGVLPPIGGSGGTNQPPAAVDGVLDPAIAGAATTVTLVGTDPEGATPLSYTVAPSTVPAGWTISVAGNVATVTPPLTATPGAYAFDFVVGDPVAPFATDSGTISVNVVSPPTNLPPDVPDLLRQARAGTPLLVPLPVTDPENDQPITITSIGNVPVTWPTPTISGLNVTLTPPVGASGQFPLTYTARDGLGNEATGNLTVNICAASITGVTITGGSASAKVLGNNRLQEQVRVDISSNGFCDALALTFVSQTGQTVEHVEPMGGGTFVEIGLTEYLWTRPPAPNGTIAVTLNLRQGGNGPIEDTDVLVTAR